MNVSKSDILWSYGAQFFSVATGVIVLPAILKMLSTEDIALYYVILNIGSLVTVFDFGFSAQFSRNFAYVFSGAQEIVSDGIDVKVQDEINYKLLKTLIETAKRIYFIISFLSLLIMLTAGSVYITSVTNNFQNSNNILILWSLYSLSVFFNLYYMYLTPLVRGMGKIKETQQATVFSRIAYLLIAFILLFFHFGLFSIVIANLISPFVSRIILKRTFYKKEIKNIFKNIKILSEEKKDCFKAIWYNAKKLGIVTISSIGITKSAMFFAGLYLDAETVASFGLLQQLVTIITGISITLFNTYTPKISGLLVNGNRKEAFNDFKLCMGSFYLIFIFLSYNMIIFGSWGLSLIKANAILPSFMVMTVYCFINLLEQNHSLFANYITLENTIPFVIPSIISSSCIILGDYLGLRFSSFGIWILILVPGIVQLAYNNWKWPYLVTKNNHVNFFSFFGSSIVEVCIYGFSKIKRLFRK